MTSWLVGVNVPLTTLLTVTLSALPEAGATLMVSLPLVPPITRSVPEPQVLGTRPVPLIVTVLVTAVLAPPSLSVAVIVPVWTPTGVYVWLRLVGEPACTGPGVAPSPHVIV